MSPAPIEVSLGAPMDTAYVLGLLALPEMGPRRLEALLRRASPRDAWASLARWQANRAHLPDGPELRGSPERLFRGWAAAAARLDPVALLREHEARGFTVLALGDAAYPAELAAGPEAPLLVFAQGDLGSLLAPTVAIVGTRRATPYGLGLARSWGLDLAAAGVAVVSGLATGIDAAAHRGALAVDGAAPVGVVGTGLDVVYPASNTGLWHAVAQRGLLLSEAPLGSPPEPWRFPARNRIMAALAQVVVIVESHATGGALITAEFAVNRGRTVLAVPGSVHSAASVGANKLLRDGAGVATGVDDILTCLSLTGVASSGRRTGGGSTTVDDPAMASVLEALGWEPATLDELASRTATPLGQLCATVDRMLAAGLVQQRGASIIRKGDS